VIGSQLLLSSTKFLSSTWSMMFMMLLIVFPMTALSFRTEAGFSETQIENATGKTWKSMTTMEQYLQMAKMADASYTSAPVDGWEIYDSRMRDWAIAASDSRKNIATLYHRPAEKLCALAFSGSDDARDWMYNLNIIPRAYCGMYNVHSGFANAMEKFWKEHRGKELVHQIEGDLCKSGTLVVGHSLGGVKAVLFAACNNRQVRTRRQRVQKRCKRVCKRDNCLPTGTNPIATNTPYIWAPVRTMSQSGCCAFWAGACDACCPYRDVNYGGYVIGVYTFGAPAVSLGRQVENRKRADRSFPGARFYIYEDDFTYDTFPNILTHLHYFHPKMNAIKLGAENEAAAMKVWSFRESFSRKAPNVILPQALLKATARLTEGSVQLVASKLAGTKFQIAHSMSSYIKRLEALQFGTR